MILAFSDNFASDLFEGAGAIVIFAGLGLALLVAGFYAVDVVTPGKLVTIIRSERNHNATLLSVCALVAMGLIVAASIAASSGDLIEATIVTAVWGIVGVAAQLLATLVFRYILGIDAAHLMEEKKIEPSAVLLGAMQVTIGLVTAVAVFA